MPAEQWFRRDVLRLLEQVNWESPSKYYLSQRAGWKNIHNLPRQLTPLGVALSVGTEMTEALTLLAMCSITDNQSHSAWSSAGVTLCSAITTDLQAIHTLCRSGFDVQARSLLRGLVEKCDLFLALYDDEGRCQEYIESASFEGSRDFFYKKISKGKLARAAHQRFKDLQLESAIGDWLWGVWRKDLDLMVNAAVHPNHTVSMMTLFPNLGRGSRSKAIGLRGAPTHGSMLTLVYALRALIPIAMLAKNETFRADGLAGIQMQGEVIKAREMLARTAAFVLIFSVEDSKKLVKRHRASDSVD